MEGHGSGFNRAGYLGKSNGGGGVWERGFFTNQATIKKGDVERVASGCTS